MNIDSRSLVMGIIIGVGTMLIVHFIVLLLRPWRHAFFSGVQVSLVQILGMRLRGNPPQLLVDAYIMLIKANVKVQIAYVEVVYIENKNRSDTPEQLAEMVKIYLEKYNK